MAKAKKTKSKSNQTTDRRVGKDRRASQDRRKSGQPVAVERRKTHRRKTQRRRQIDPTTCERDYTRDEIEFMQALDAYKRASGRMFPTCSEILEVIRNLGYEKRSDSPTQDSSGQSAGPADKEQPQGAST